MGTLKLEGLVSSIPRLSQALHTTIEMGASQFQSLGVFRRRGDNFRRRISVVL
jgi:hypothetical protein